MVPLLVLMLCAIIDFGQRYAYASTLHNAASVAARDLSITNNVTTARNAGVAAGAPTTGWTIPACPSDATVTVEVTAQRATLTRMFGTTFSVTGRATVRCQR